MEIDCQSIDSGEGPETSEIHDNFENITTTYVDEEDNEVEGELLLEAKTVYLLLPKTVQVSRATRLQWLLDRINTTISVQNNGTYDSASNDIEIVSIIPREQTIVDCNRFFINSHTELVYLAHTYKFAYCIDMSPSQSIVDIQKGEILFDEILNCFKISITSLVKEFIIPGNSLIFQPVIYLTVIVNTPFFISPAQQVLVKGVRLNAKNLNVVISLVEHQFHILEGMIADISSMIYDQNESQRIQNEALMGSLFELPETGKNYKKIPIVSPDVNFVNMLRYSMLAISLLPPISLSHIIVITDGVVAMPDSSVMESLLFQLHYDSISVSFLKVGSTFHPHSGAGYLSYTDLLYFFANSTLGGYVENYSDIKIDVCKSMNIYHQLLLLWSFHTSNRYDFNRTYDMNKWISPNTTFCSDRMPSLLSKRESDDNVNVSILLLLSRRLREGFVVNSINLINDIIEIRLCLQWKAYIYIIYKLSAQWPSIKNNTRFEISISAPYEFLHDITCTIKKETKSLYRQRIIERFWIRLSQISLNDLEYAQQICSFHNSNTWYTLPESVRNRIPVFITNTFNSDSKKFILSPSITCTNFKNAWQFVCQMEVIDWRKWFHTHKISFILKHDQPLPKYIHLPNSSQRYQIIQCRQATTALYGMLCKWSSFILIDNHTYIKFIYKEPEKPPKWFCVVRITSKLPCAVLLVGFLTNTPGLVRNRICDELRTELCCLTYMPSPGKSKENVCCILLHKPVERILIRYERMPQDFNTVIFPDGTQPPQTTYNLTSPLTGSLFTTLSRYLYHKRWIWSAAYYTNLKLTDCAVSRILNALTRMRLKEGFSFAYSSSGIITMVLEVRMDTELYCILQYVLFPPHKAFLGEEQTSSSDEDNEIDIEPESELQIVTEIWIEPQYGKVRSNNKKIDYMDNKLYNEIADAIREIDMQCIKSLLTIEHLNLMCEEKKAFDLCRNNVELPDKSAKSNGNSSEFDMLEYCNLNSNFGVVNSKNSSTDSYFIESTRIEYIPFSFDPINILPLCQQSELLFSMFREKNDDKNDANYKSNRLLIDNIHQHLLQLHDQELHLTKDESDKFTQQLFVRHKFQTHYCPIVKPTNNIPEITWRCFVKGVSVTHVILTFIPASLDDLEKLTLNCEETFYTSSLCLPIYVSDCSLSALIEAYVNNTDEYKSNIRDSCEDRRFKSLELIKEEITKLKLDDSASSSPEPKSEESEISEKYYWKHCRHLILIHSKCFVLSLFIALQNSIFIHNLDIQSAMEICEENVSEIDITEYILTVCGHVRVSNDEKITNDILNEPFPCNEMNFFHNLIRTNFYKVLTTDFEQVITNTEYYYFNSHKNDNSESKQKLIRMESGCNVLTGDLNPLFLHLICTLKSGGEIFNTTVTVLPTCLSELTSNLNPSKEINKNKLKITLDILYRTLPIEVQTVCTYSTPITPITDTNFEFPLLNLPDYQKKAVTFLHEEIEWLLKDEIATSLLDITPTTLNILNFVTRHVTNSKKRASCVLEVINLNFVYDTDQSHQKFIDEFIKIRVLSYKIGVEGEYYYVVKDGNLKIRNGSKSECNKEDNLNETKECHYWLTILNNKRLNLPNFWLIMKIEQEAVTIFFHCRFLHILNDYYNVYQDVQKEIRKLCKKVNQSLLLQSLYETKICNQLLEPDDNFKDWRSDILPSSVARSSYAKLRMMEEKYDDTDQIISNITSEASLQFKAGHFSCPVVWETHFVLHPRLKTGPGKPGTSRGILALKNTLDKFSVSNRNNMFVYKDNDSNVFYLRLQENLQNSNRNSSLRSSDYESAIVSRSPSIASLPLGQKNSLTQYIASNSDLRPRVRSFGEKESKDGPNEDTLILKVHGITEAGKDVQCDLIQVLQNRLDDAVLDFLSLMLARNSMCPLTPEDVHFIQKPFKPPQIIIRFTMQEFVIHWLDSFVHYLRQNLLQFLNIPKYTDSRLHYHFKDYSEPEQASHHNPEENIFIYNQSQNPSSGNKGIACVALAVITTKSTTYSRENLRELIEETFRNKTFKNLIASEIIEETSELPEFYLEFRLWKQGRVNVDNLSTKLKDAVSQATWDMVMEYFLLQGPLCVEKNGKIPKIIPIDLDKITLDLGKEIEFNCPIEMTSNDRSLICDTGKRKLEHLNLFKKYKRVNPPSSKASRSITFDDYEREQDIYNQRLLNAKPLIKLNSFETGDDGVLSNNYSKLLPIWMEFGSKMSTPSIRKQKINLNNCHLSNVTIRELLNLIPDSPKPFYALPTHALVSESDDIFIPYNSSNPVKKCAIISRNFDQWKASTAFNGPLDYPDIMSPHALKQAQKFVPITVNNKFIPRQKILWCLIENDCITIYSYNWGKEHIDKLILNCTKLGQWLSVRSCFLQSITSQKLGLFHNQAMKQKNFVNAKNPYAHVVGFVNYMTEFPKDNVCKNLAHTPDFPRSILEVYRDSFYVCKYLTDDPVTSFTFEIDEMRQSDKKSHDEIKKLHEMYQSRTSTATISQIFLLTQNSRIIHYCHTPILFLSKWRFKSAATRDNTLCPQENLIVTKKLAILEDDTWYSELCYGFLCEYRRYLQTLGFMPLQIANSNRKQGKRIDSSSYNSTFYIQKTILGGILFFTVEFNEPFFTTVLHAIECNRLQTVTSSASINRFNLNFIDECDRIKILMHLHSFTYDYHLRCIYNYISNVSGVNKVCDKYDVNQFFDDFLKYYNKTPNFARNLLHADTITIKDLLTEGKQLYDYLLTNVGQYNFKVVEVEKCDGDSEFILVQITSTSHVSYKDFQDQHHTDDFEITLIVSNMCTPYNPTDNVLHLKYYLVLTSRREIYPKSEIEQKLGKFRTVSSTTNYYTLMEKSSINFDMNQSQMDDRSIASSNDTSQMNAQENYREISQESVNYLGYFSSHEQLMQQLIMDKANATQKHIREMVSKGMVHCRIHILWNTLVSPPDNGGLTFDEFIELKDLAKLEHLCDLRPDLGPLLNKPLNWYQGLAKLLLAKYVDHHRYFVSTDGKIQHYVILHPRYFGAFMLLSIDLHTASGELYAVYREPHKQDAELCIAYGKSLLDGFVNCICFYLWSEMI